MHHACSVQQSKKLSLLTYGHACEGGSDVEAGTDMDRRHPFMWHPNQSAAQILAIGDNERILFANIPAAADAVADTGCVECNASASQLPTGMTCVQCPRLVTTLTFSADGAKLAAVVGQNEVRPTMHHTVTSDCSRYTSTGTQRASCTILLRFHLQ